MRKIAGVLVATLAIAALVLVLSVRDAVPSAGPGVVLADTTGPDVMPTIHVVVPTDERADLYREVIRLSNEIDALEQRVQELEAARAEPAPPRIDIRVPTER